MSKLIIAVALLLGIVLIAACSSGPLDDARPQNAAVATTAVNSMNNDGTPDGIETATFALG